VLLVLAVSPRKLLLSMDERGSILLPEPPAGGSAPGGAPLLELPSILQPQFRHTLEPQRAQDQRAEPDDQRRS
jgi:hypothetical protein